MRLLDYLPYSMKDSDSVARSPKKANTKKPSNGSCSNTKITQFLSSFYSSNANTSLDTTACAKNGTIKKRIANSTGDNGGTIEKRGRKKKTAENNIAPEKSSKSITNGTKRKKSISSSQVSTASSSSSTSSSTIILSTPTKKETAKTKKSAKGNNKSSPKLRPRRRASQTYFFKYQLARNPLKAEEEDLKLALLASLQQDDGEISKQHMQQLKRQQLIYEHHLQNNNNHCKQPRKGVNGNNQPQSSKQQKQKQPPPSETVVQHYKPTPPAYDEEYLQKYRPDTEDFLTFICSRLQRASDYASSPSPKHITNESSASNCPTASGSIDFLPHYTNFKPLNGCTPTNTGINVRISNDKTSNELNNLRRSASPCKSSASNQTASNSSPNCPNSPSNRRRPTRHSPRLASTSKKISEFDTLNQYTAYESQITYEEEMNRASMALEDIAQEINGPGEPESDQQNAATNTDGKTGTGSSETNSLSPYKNNKHLVRGLMTREFAGAFADEEIIFESIKNHKL